MEYSKLLDMATDLGYELAMSGAETFRVEDSISRVLAAYGIQSEVFAIPNYLIVSILTEDGTPMTRMRRIGCLPRHAHPLRRPVHGRQLPHRRGRAGHRTERQPISSKCLRHFDEHCTRSLVER